METQQQRQQNKIKSREVKKQLLRYAITQNQRQTERNSNQVLRNEQARMNRTNQARAQAILAQTVKRTGLATIQRVNENGRATRGQMTEIGEQINQARNTLGGQMTEIGEQINQATNTLVGQIRASAQAPVITWNRRIIKLGAQLFKKSLPIIPIIVLPGPWLLWKVVLSPAINTTIAIKKKLRYIWGGIMVVVVVAGIFYCITYNGDNIVKGIKTIIKPLKIVSNELAIPTYLYNVGLNQIQLLISLAAMPFIPSTYITFNTGNVGLYASLLAKQGKLKQCTVRKSISRMISGGCDTTEILKDIVSTEHKLYSTKKTNYTLGINLLRNQGNKLSQRETALYKINPRWKTAFGKGIAGKNEEKIRITSHNFKVVKKLYLETKKSLQNITKQKIKTKNNSIAINKYTKELVNFEHNLANRAFYRNLYYNVYKGRPRPLPKRKQNQSIRNENRIPPKKLQGLGSQTFEKIVSGILHYGKKAGFGTKKNKINA